MGFRWRRSSRPGLRDRTTSGELGSYPSPRRRILCATTPHAASIRGQTSVMRDSDTRSHGRLPDRLSGRGGGSDVSGSGFDEGFGLSGRLVEIVIRRVVALIVVIIAARH